MVSVVRLLILSPYSLGKLIDWKLEDLPRTVPDTLATPYSLGKLIDWKLLENQNLGSGELYQSLPTR
jgi:hypothetical protein